MRMGFRFGALVAAVVAVGFLFLTSCTPASPATTDQPAAATKPQGSLRLGMPFFTGVIFANTGNHLAAGDTYRSLGAGTFDSLVDLSPEGQVRPAIAERWEISPDGKTQTFYIRKGVKFQDGRDLTGADVKYSLELYLAPEFSGDAAIWRSFIDKVELKDDYTVVLRLKQPLFELLVGMANFSGAAAVLPKKYIEEKGFDSLRKTPIGSGPWKVVSFEPNTRLELEALESHWRAVPKFKNVTLLHVQEESAKVAMLKTGELDMAEVSPESAAGLRTAGLRILKHYGASQYFAWMWWDMDNPQKYSFSDARVRKAMSYAVNRQEMADKLYSGYAEPSVLFYMPKSAYYYDPSIHKPDPYDAGQAKKLLAEAGYISGLSTKYWDVRPGTILSTLNEAVAGYWRKIGINTELTAMEYATFSRWRFSPKVPDLWNTVFSQLSGGGIFNFERFNTPYHSVKGTPLNHTNTRLNELIDKVPMTADPAEKKKIASEAATLAINERSTISMLDIYTVYALGARIGEIAPIKGSVGVAASLETITHAK